MNNNKQKKHLGALDIFIILILVVAIISVGLRFYSTKIAPTGNNVQLENYILSFKVMNIKDSSAQNYFEKDTKFFIDETNVYLGTLREGLSIKDAETYYQMHDGTVVVANNNGTGDMYRVDVEGSMNVIGTMDDRGCFYLNGNLYLAPNKEITVYSKYLTVAMKITGIAIAQ